MYTSKYVIIIPIFYCRKVMEMKTQSQFLCQRLQPM